MRTRRAAAALTAAALYTCSFGANAGPIPVFGDPTNTKSPRLQQRLPRPIVDPATPGDLGTPTPGPSIETFPGDLIDALSPTNFGNQPHPDRRVTRSFEALSDWDVRLFGRALIPPDTMGAVGRNEFVQTINGGFGVFDKKTGQLKGATSDVDFWQQLGLEGTSGDPRILYNAELDRWITLAFGANTKDLNVAVSTTSDPLGDWKATKYEALAPIGLGLQTIADYPTLAYDNNAVYIATNNFAQDVSGGPTSFRGTTLFVLPVDDVFDANGPVVANLQAFNTPFVSGDPNNDTTRGFAIQGVNSREAADGTGHVVAASAFINGVLAYDVVNAGTPAAALTDATIIDRDYLSNLPGRQPGRPDAINPGPLRNIDTLDDRVATSAWELNGKTYFVHTITPDDGDLDGSNDYTRVRVYVIDSDTKALIQQIDIGDGAFDYYQGSLAVSGSQAGGKLVLNYNRSGYDPATGRISIFANVYRIREDGRIVLQGSPILVKESLTPGYLNGAPEISGTPNGRQRWGDYSAVTVDPNDPATFWLIGEFAREPYEQPFPPAFPSPSGFSRWGQYVAAISAPAPASLGVMLFGLAALGLRVRRQVRA